MPVYKLLSGPLVLMLHRWVSVWAAGGMHWWQQDWQLAKAQLAQGPRTRVTMSCIQTKALHILSVVVAKTVSEAKVLLLLRWRPVQAAGGAHGWQQDWQLARG